MVSLGGCVVGHLATTMNGRAVRHTRHLWRRPTIAMMSKPVSRFRLDFSHIPPEYANYLVNDAAGVHRQEIEQVVASDETVFVFDVTRDVLTGVAEIEPDVWIMDPVDAVYQVEGLTPDTMTEEILKQLSRGSARRMSAVRNWDEFFPVWKKAFLEFAQVIEGRFETVIAAEIYPTLKRYDRTNPFYIADTAAANACLDHIYAWLRETFDFQWITIPREYSITGLTGVPYNGPAPTHFIEESHTLMAAQFLDKIGGLVSGVAAVEPVKPLVEQAFKRAELHEEALEEIKTLKSRLDAAEADAERQVDELRQALEAAKLSQARAEANYETVFAQYSAAEQARRHAVEAMGALKAERDALRAAAERNPVAKIRRHIARKTRGLRGVRV